MGERHSVSRRSGGAKREDDCASRRSQPIKARRTGMVHNDVASPILHKEREGGGA